MRSEILNKKTLLIAALLSGMVSAAYACPDLGHSFSYSFCRQISLAGAPGILIAAVVSMALLGGAHGGGPLAMLLIIAAAINFLLSMGLAVAGRAVWKMLKNKER